MRVVNLLDQIMADLEIDDAQLGRELGIDYRSIKKIRTDETEWALSRSNLRKLMLFAFEKGYQNGIFEIQLHPVWTGLSNSPVSIFRSSRSWDSTVEMDLWNFFELIGEDQGIDVTTHVDFEGDTTSIVESMNSTNCIFIGSPKANPASEVAIATMWDAEPFDTDRRNRAAIPFQLVGMSPINGNPSSAVIESSTRCGIVVKPPGTKEAGFIRVDSLPAHEYREFSGTGQDAAVVAIQRRQLPEHKVGTSIVISGFTGRATMLAARRMMYGDPGISDADLASGEPTFAAIRYQFRKRRYRRGKLSGLRSVVKDSVRFGPPWPEFFEA